MPLLFSSTLTLVTSLFFFFTLFKTFQNLDLGVRFRVSVRATVRVKARVRLRVYLLCLLCFCQACCHRHLGGKIDTVNNLS